MLPLAPTLVTQCYMSVITLLFPMRLFIETLERSAFVLVECLTFHKVSTMCSSFLASRILRVPPKVSVWWITDS